VFFAAFAERRLSTLSLSSLCSPLPSLVSSSPPLRFVCRYPAWWLALTPFPKAHWPPRQLRVEAKVSHSHTQRRPRHSRRDNDDELLFATDADGDDNLLFAADADDVLCRKTMLARSDERQIRFLGVLLIVVIVCGIWYLCTDASVADREGDSHVLFCRSARLYQSGPRHPRGAAVLERSWRLHHHSRDGGGMGGAGNDRMCDTAGAPNSVAAGTCAASAGAASAAAATKQTPLLVG
jgi:hypothetical protein